MGGEAEPPVRRSFGRRKTASSSSSSMKKKKKKVPQRGMGVEKLERQRIQQEWNKINHHVNLGFVPNSDMLLGNNFSTELSSTPNSVNCNFQPCNACHKLGSEQICKVDNQIKNQGNNNGNKGGGLVGVHRKGSSMVMEYDFFPSSNKADDEVELVMMTSSSSFSSPNWLDLSLKLSN